MDKQLKKFISIAMVMLLLIGNSFGIMASNEENMYIITSGNEAAAVVKIQELFPDSIFNPFEFEKFDFGSEGNLGEFTQDLGAGKSITLTYKNVDGQHMVTGQ